MKKAIANQIDDNTWRFTETFAGTDVYCYLLTGDEKALLIDSGYGFTDLRKAISEITEKPVEVVNTHGHVDHILGNWQFDSPIYINAKDRDVYCRHSDSSYILELLSDQMGDGFKTKLIKPFLGLYLKILMRHRPPLAQPLPECGFFQLGNRKIIIVETPGHTAGSISLIDENNGYFFSGDTICHDGVILSFAESTTITEYLDTIGKIKKLLGNGLIRVNFPSHQQTPLSFDILNSYEKNCRDMLANRITDKQWKDGLFISETGMKIHFDPDRLREEIENV
jgi:glyoxylase-like metal-dependent hydrolase (beta-lactamase superfamily II)